MGLFDSLEGMAGQFIGGEAHEALNGALQGSSFGGLDGLLSHLQQGGLAGEVESWSAGGGSPIGVDQLRSVLSEEHVQGLASSLGLDTDQVLGLLSQHLPALTAANAGG